MIARAEGLLGRGAASRRELFRRRFGEKQELAPRTALLQGLSRSARATHGCYRLVISATKVLRTLTARAQFAGDGIATDTEARRGFRAAAVRELQRHFQQRLVETFARFGMQ